MRFGILFDMDGVLIDSNPYHKKALDVFLSAHKYSLSEEERKKKLYGRANKDWIQEVFGGGLDAARLLELGSEKEAIWRQLYADAIEPVTGLVPFLEHLKGHQIPIAIGTSAPFENVVFTLQKCKLESYFEVILHQDHVVKGKPDPEIYINCAAAIGLPTDHCVVIEDSLAGVTAGLAAGCKVIGITTTHTESELSNCHLVITDFNDLDVVVLQQLFTTDLLA